MAKLDNFSQLTYSDLWDYHLRFRVEGKESEISLRNKFLFCGGILDYNDKGEVSERCLQLLEYQGMLLKEGDKLLQASYLCRNCKYKARLKTQAIVQQQKWTDSPHRTLTFKDYEFDNFGNETASVFTIHVPYGPVYKIVEEIDGANCYHTEVSMTPEEKARYYLRGFVPDKVLK